MITKNHMNTQKNYLKTSLYFDCTLPLFPSMSIFEDTFTVTAVDPDGKVFERGKLLLY